MRRIVFMVVSVALVAVTVGLGSGGAFSAEKQTPAGTVGGGGHGGIVTGRECVQEGEGEEVCTDLKGGEGGGGGHRVAQEDGEFSRSGGSGSGGSLLREESSSGNGGGRCTGETGAGTQTCVGKGFQGPTVVDVPTKDLP